MASRQKNGGGAFVGAGLHLWHFVSSSKIRETHPLDQFRVNIVLEKYVQPLWLYLFFAIVPDVGKYLLVITYNWL
jgi:hypothetical protein